MSDPTQETTMTTTPTGPVTDAMVGVAFSTWMSHDGTALCRMRLAIEAALSAMPADEPDDAAEPNSSEFTRLAEALDIQADRISDLASIVDAMPVAAPTTPEPDGFAEKIDRVLSEQWDSLNAMSQRIFDHDAALTELRERLDRLDGHTHELEMTWNGEVGSTTAPPDPTPPAVPDAMEDELDNLEDQINEACREITRERTTKVRLTPAPDVSDVALADLYDKAFHANYPQDLIDAINVLFGECIGVDGMVPPHEYDDEARRLIKAVRAYDVAHPTPAPDVPELPDAWWTYEITKRDGHIEAEIWLADADETILSGVGQSRTEALAAAIANATKDGGQ